MKDEIQTAEIELPQLRQLVINNTLRISRNEESINEMKEKFNEEEKRRRERETYWDVAREEHDRAHREHEQEMRELRELLRDHSVRFDEDLKRYQEKDEERHRKFEEDMKRRREEDEERHRKFDEDLKRSREEDEERHRKFEEDIQKSREEREKWHQEFNASLQKSREEDEERQKRWDAEHEKFHKDFAAIQKENREILKGIDSKIKEISSEFKSTVGHIVEGLLGPRGHKMFLTAGFKVDCYCKDMKRSSKELNTGMEVDYFAYGKDQAIATEIKTNCRRSDIDHFLDKMKLFKKLFPEHADKEVLAAIAAVNFERDAYDYAKEQGILIIHVKDETVFTLDPVPDKSVLRRF